jgi:D-3-phosphoglycerate dehydrogenase / 2-oxoglutarate reductase
MRLSFGASDSESDLPDRGSVVLAEEVHPVASEVLSAAGFRVIERSAPLHLCDDIPRPEAVRAIGIRSRSRVDRQLLATLPNLEAVSCFCAGTDNVNLELCRSRGLKLDHAPGGSARSVAELALCAMIALLRGVPDANRALHEGSWRRSPHSGREAAGARLGIVGYGAVGSSLSALAESIGMCVRFFDLRPLQPVGAARRVHSLEALLEESDVVSIHVDGRPSNRGLISEEKLARMVPAAILLNFSRGHVVDLQAVAASLRAGKIGGCAADVFEDEPAIGSPFSCPLSGIPNVLLTPHIGARTVEAQSRIAATMARRLVEALTRSSRELTR